MLTRLDQSTYREQITSDAPKRCTSTIMRIVQLLSHHSVQYFAPPPLQPQLALNVTYDDGPRAAYQLIAIIINVTGVKGR